MPRIIRRTQHGAPVRSAGNFDYMQQRREPIRLDPRTGRICIFIGLDFGTTYTKVAYRIGGDNVDKKFSVKFGSGFEDDAYYRESVLVFDASDSSLKFSDDDSLPNCSLVRYFKMTMIVDGLEKNKSLNQVHATKNNKERLCSAFFLANVIAESMAKICKAHSLSSERVNWAVNLGVPLVRNDAKTKYCRDIYNEVLNVAFSIAKIKEVKDRMPLAIMDKLYTRYCNRREQDLNTIPELYAEVLMYQQDTNVPEGFYAVVDIGGGTSDVAVFYKKYDKQHASSVTCVAQHVLPLGFESIVKNVIKTNQSDALSIARIFLRVDDVIYLSHPCNIRTVDAPIMADVRCDFEDEALKANIHPQRLQNCRNDLAEQYSKQINDAKQNYKNTMHRLARQGIGITYFILGGAGNVPLYRQCVEWVNDQIIPELALQAQRANIQHFLQHQDLVLDRRDQRLLISQMLAQPFHEIPDFNIWTRPEVIAVPVPKPVDLESIQRELYGD